MRAFTAGKLSCTTTIDGILPELPIGIKLRWKHGYDAIKKQHFAHSIQIAKPKQKPKPKAERPKPKAERPKPKPEAQKPTPKPKPKGRKPNPKKSQTPTTTTACHGFKPYDIVVATSGTKKGQEGKILAATGNRFMVKWSDGGIRNYLPKNLKLR